MERKGQSALEYLMTYGWALVVIVIVVAALVVFGVFSTPKNCSQFGGNLLLRDFDVSSNGIQLLIQNNEATTITNITLSAEGLTPDNTNPTTLATGSYGTFKLNGTLSGTIKKEITVTYNTAGITGKQAKTICVGTI